MTREKSWHKNSGVQRHGKGRFFGKETGPKSLSGGWKLETRPRSDLYTAETEVKKDQINLMSSSAGHVKPLSPER